MFIRVFFSRILKALILTIKKKADADVDNAAELDAEMEMAMAEFDIGKNSTDIKPIF